MGRSLYRRILQGLWLKTEWSTSELLRSAHQSGTLLELALASLLLCYCSTPHAITGVPPYMMFLGRSLHTRLDLLTPNVGARVRDRHTQQKDYSDERRRERKLSVGQSVWARNFGEGVRTKVLEQSGPVSFVLQLEDGRLWRRHVDHLRLGVLATPLYATVEVFPCSLPAEPPLVAESDSPAQPLRNTDSASCPNDSVNMNPPNVDPTAPHGQPSAPLRHLQHIRRQPDRLYGTLGDVGHRR
jgi:hypothetical protein